MAKIQQTINGYEKACNDLIILFCNKQDLDFTDWQGAIGEIAEFDSHYFLNLSDIIHDLKTNQKKGLILEWHEEGLVSEITDEEIDAILKPHEPTNNTSI